MLHSISNVTKSAGRCAKQVAASGSASVSAGRTLHTSLATLSLGSLAASRARDVESKWRGTSTSGGSTKNYVNGCFIDSNSPQKWIDVHDPATQTLLTRVPDTNEDEFNQAVKAAEAAFPSWSETTLLTRQQVMFR